ncbi:arylsulfatase [Prolixibacteraceae bacterium JC049]|nr:arylsulfatase [Prolixibacteraceae bacterium JC049]
MKQFLFTAALCLFSILGWAKQKPNVVIIYADDLGIGDVSAYGQQTLKTPGMDRIANEGIRFNCGYATSATCTPSRYSLLTGSYPWRNKKAQVLPGDAPLLISTDQPTLPKMLRTAGYTTGIVGKWHLGLGTGKVDWNKRVSPGPNEVGFDYAYIMAATNDRTPTVFVKNGYVDGLEESDPLYVSYRKNFDNLPTGKNNPEMLKMNYSMGHNNSIQNGISRIGYQKGGKAAMWIDENMADTFLVQAQRFVKTHKEKPFFLYYALHQPHVPRVPHQRFAGKTGLGPRGDAIAEADWCVREFLKTLEEENLLENTIVIFSSDNGPILDDGYYDDAVEKLGAHKPAGKYRGNKYSLFDAGTHVPFMVMWKGKIKPKQSDALVCQIDLLSSLAKMVGGEIPKTDSEDVLAALLGKSKKGRKQLITEGLHHRTAIRKDKWLLIPSYKGPKKPSWVDAETGFDINVQLFDLEKDPMQKNNLTKKYPKKVDQLLKQHQAIKGDQ